LDASAPAAPAASDAGPEAAVAENPPAFNTPDMSAAPTYPASALYDAFSGATAKAKLIACYLPGKARDPKLRGKVIVKFTINSNGSVKPAASEGSTLQDDDVIACVIRTVKTMHFTKPLEGSVTVIYPLIFRSSGDETLILPDAGKKKPQ
jgi:outer membrane biosynthesis protein TonB